MGYIKYSKNNSWNIDAIIPIPKLDSSKKHNIIIYDMSISNFDVFVKQIVMTSNDSHIVVCLTTINDEFLFYEATENNLNLDQIKLITLKTKEHDFVIPDISAYFDNSYDFSMDPQSYNFNDSYSYGTIEPPNPNLNSNSKLKNDDESKDNTSLWMFLINNLWVVVFFTFIIMIGVSVYITRTHKKGD